MSPFSILMKELRTWCDLTQVEFALKLNVEQSYVSAIEVGKKGPPSADFIAKLIEAFDLDNRWERRLEEALDLSQRRMELPKGTSCYCSGLVLLICESSSQSLKLGAVCRDPQLRKQPQTCVLLSKKNAYIIAEE